MVGGNIISVYFDRAVINLAALFIYLTNIKLSSIIATFLYRGFAKFNRLLHYIYYIRYRNCS